MHVQKRDPQDSRQYVASSAGSPRGWRSRRGVGVLPERAIVSRCYGVVMTEHVCVKCRGQPVQGAQAPEVGRTLWAERDHMKRFMVAEGDARSPGAYASDVDCVVTSPPYAEQRRAYGGVSPAEYPQFTLDWFDAVPLSDSGCIAVVIRPGQKQGRVEQYVLRTRLHLQEHGWIEIEELIWVKPDAPPLGSTRRPRRSWESVLVYSRSPDPYMNTKAGGRLTDRVYQYGDISSRSGELHGGQKAKKGGATRGRDVIEVACGNGIDREWKHPAPYPTALAAHLIDLLCPPSGVVCDPFCGSGTTGEAALDAGCCFVGVDSAPEFAAMSRRRLRERFPPEVSER